MYGFDIDEEVGGGGVHHYFRARRASDGRRVLLKASGDGVGSGERARSLFERELDACRDLGVDGVLTALNLVDDVGSAVLVLADAPATPLDHVLGRRGCLCHWPPRWRSARGLLAR